MQRMRAQIFSGIYSGSIKFFRRRLLTSSPEQINDLVEGMQKDCQQIRREALKMSWFMRGGLTYDQAMSLALDERNLIGELIKDNLETTKKSGLPFF